MIQKPGHDTVFSTEEAAAYVGVERATIDHHVHVSQSLSPDGQLGRSNGFYKSTLDEWMANRAGPGRPSQYEERADAKLVDALQYHAKTETQLSWLAVLETAKADHPQNYGESVPEWFERLAGIITDHADRLDIVWES